MADTIKQFTNDYKDYLDIGKTNVAFTNDGTTTRVVKNVLVQAIGDTKSIDLILDGKPIYKNLSIPANGTLKLENENLIVPPSSTLSYRVVNGDSSKLIDISGYSSRAHGGYVDSNGDVHTFKASNTSPDITHYVNNTAVGFLGTTSSIESTFGFDAKEVGDNIYFALGSHRSVSPFASKLFIFKYNKTDKTSVLQAVSSSYVANPSSYQSTNLQVVIDYCEQTGMIAAAININTSTQLPVIMVSEFGKVYDAVLYNANEAMITTEATSTTVGMSFLSNGNLLIAHGSNAYSVLNPTDGTAVSSGTFSGSNTVTANTYLTIHMFDDDSFIIHSPTQIIRKYSSTFTLLASSAVAYKEAFLITPMGEIWCSLNSNNTTLAILNQDLTPKTTHLKYFHPSGLFTGNGANTKYKRALLDKNNYQFNGLCNDQNVLSHSKYYYYNAINIKIDGVEVTA